MIDILTQEERVLIALQDAPTMRDHIDNIDARILAHFPGACILPHRDDRLRIDFAIVYDDTVDCWVVWRDGDLLAVIPLDKRSEWPLLVIEASDSDISTRDWVWLAKQTRWYLEDQQTEV